MNHEIEQIHKDINYESQDLIDVNFDKLSVGWEYWDIGTKICWCYNDDIKFWNDEKFFGEKVKNEDREIWYKNNCGFQGILFTFPDKRFRIDENAVVCCYDYPIEKENPTCFWVSLDRLLISPGLYKIYKI